MADQRGTHIGRTERRRAAWAILALVVLASLPTLVAWAIAPGGTQFTGLLFNPQDTSSYLAKMRQGLAGSWRFRLPYTPEPHEGAPVYLFYLLLGHAARWTGLPLIVLYQAARLLGGGVMLVALYRLAARTSRDVSERWTAFLLAATGAGLGWLVVWAGVQTADLWVPEAFPVYALLANAHFPLSIGLMALVADCGLRVSERREHTWAPGACLMAAAVALGVIQPFGLVAAFGGLGVTLLAQAVRERALPWRAAEWLVAACAVALPYPLASLRAIEADPVLAAWNAQNVTPSLPLWDWALSYGLVLALAVAGGAQALRRRSGSDWLLLGWVAITLAGMYVPLPLQRRLSLGLGVPIGLLAGMGWSRLVRPRTRARRRGLTRALVVTFCTLTPLLLILMALLATQAGHPLLAPSEGDWAAFTWLRENADTSRVVLCAPDTGNLVPAWAGQRVVYGHPFETVDADRRKVQVEAYSAGEMGEAERETFLAENRVSLILVGPRERALGAGETWQPGAAELVFEAEGVKVYEVAGE
jgi:hypothetical protein